MRNLSADELRGILQDQLDAGRAAPKPGWIAFREMRSKLSSPPAAITHPDQYDGLPYLCIQGKAEGLSASAQKTLAARWCEALPTLSAVKYLWLYSCAPQLFEAACGMDGLEGLSIAYSGIESIEQLRNLHNLKHLSIAGVPKLRDIAPLTSLPKLDWLQLENVRCVNDLETIAHSSGLLGLSVTGAEGRPLKIDTLAPIARLRKLQWLHLGGVRVADGSLRPLAQLTSLRYLSVPKWFSVSEFGWLAEQAPNTECEWFSPYINFSDIGVPCKRCGQNTLVLLSGKGGGMICSECDKKKFVRHIAKFG